MPATVRTSAAVSSVATDSDRRSTDRRLGKMELDLALAAQAAELNQKANDAQYVAVSRQLDSLTTEVRTAIANWNNVSSDAGASPAGRRLLAEIELVNRRVDKKVDREIADPVLAKVEVHDDFIQQINGALRLAKIALTTSLLSTMGTIILALSEIRP